MSPEQARVVEHPSVSEARSARNHDVIALALMLLNERAYQWASLALFSIAWGVTLWVPEIPRMVACVLFSLLLYLPTWRRKDSHGEA